MVRVQCIGPIYSNQLAEVRDLSHKVQEILGSNKEEHWQGNSVMSPVRSRIMFLTGLATNISKVDLVGATLDVLAELVVINQHSQHLLKGQLGDQGGVQVFVPVKLEHSLVQCYSDEVTSHHRLVGAAHRYTNRIPLGISLHHIFG